MTEETVVRLNLDTHGARQAARSLQPQHLGHVGTREKTSPFQNVAKGIGAIGGFRLASHMRTQAPRGANVWSEAFSPWRAALQEFIDRELYTSTKGRRAAREEIKDAYGRSVGENAANLSAATRAYSDALLIHKQEESGRNILRQDPRFRGPSIVEVLRKGIPGMVRLIYDSAWYFIDYLRTA